MVVSGSLALDRLAQSAASAGRARRSAGTTLMVIVRMTTSDPITRDDGYCTVTLVPRSCESSRTPVVTLTELVLIWTAAFTTTLKWLASTTVTCLTVTSLVPKPTNVCPCTNKGCVGSGLLPLAAIVTVVSGPGTTVVGVMASAGESGPGS